VMKYGTDIALKLLGYGQKSPALHIPMGLVYLATPIGLGLASIRLIQNLIGQFRMLFGDQEINVENERERLREEEEVKE